MHKKEFIKILNYLQDKNIIYSWNASGSIIDYIHTRNPEVELYYHSDNTYTCEVYGYTVLVDSAKQFIQAIENYDEIKNIAKCMEDKVAQIKEETKNKIKNILKEVK